MEVIVNIKITESAGERLRKALDESDFNKPALRVLFAGYG